MRWHVPVALLLIVSAAVALATFFLVDQAAERTGRGTGVAPTKPPQGTTQVRVKRTSAHDFDPLGDRKEHPEALFRAVDNDPGTAWATETYRGPLAKAGVGLYVDAAPRVKASAMEIRTNQTGWTAEIYAADQPADDVAQWKKVGGGTVDKRRTRFPLDMPDQAFRYYLVWITQLPPSAGRVEIAELSLFEPKPAP
jgi:serine/threonine-protein kinase